jgi:hypothetical protein
VQARDSNFLRHQVETKTCKENSAGLILSDDAGRVTGRLHRYPYLNIITLITNIILA